MVVDIEVSIFTVFCGHILFLFLLNLCHKFPLLRARFADVSNRVAGEGRNYLKFLYSKNLKSPNSIYHFSTIKYTFFPLWLKYFSSLKSKILIPSKCVAIIWKVIFKRIILYQIFFSYINSFIYAFFNCCIILNSCITGFTTIVNSANMRRFILSY